MCLSENEIHMRGGEVEGNRNTRKTYLGSIRSRSSLCIWVKVEIGREVTRFWEVAELKMKNLESYDLHS